MTRPVKRHTSMKQARFQRKNEEADLVLAALASPVRRAILDDLDTRNAMSVAYSPRSAGAIDAIPARSRASTDYETA